MEREFEPDTIVRIKTTGRFAKIKKRCNCGSAKILHYEAWIEDEREGKERITILDHDMLEFEWPPKDVFEDLVAVYS